MYVVQYRVRPQTNANQVNNLYLSKNRKKNDIVNRFNAPGWKQLEPGYTTLTVSQYVFHVHICLVFLFPWCILLKEIQQKILNAP